MAPNWLPPCCAVLWEGRESKAEIKTSLKNSIHACHTHTPPGIRWLLPSQIFELEKLTERWTFPRFNSSSYLLREVNISEKDTTFNNEDEQTALVFFLNHGSMNKFLGSSEKFILYVLFVLLSLVSPRLVVCQAGTLYVQILKIIFYTFLPERNNSLLKEVDRNDIYTIISFYVF